MNDDKNRKLKMTISKFKSDSKIKECFHFDHSSCSKKIIAAHSVQRNGVLSLIEDEVKGNLSIYSFLYLKYDEHGRPIGFESLGKKTASTFNGFCGFHDTTLFQKIENNPVDIENDEHCFLLSYRAFAKSAHSKKETKQGFETNEMYEKSELKSLQKDLVDGSSLAIRDNTIVKERLNDMLSKGIYDELEYFTYTLDYMVPVALATSINPEYSYSNKLLNKSMDPDVVYEFVNFIVLPTADNKTHILFSCLPEQKKSVQFIDELSELVDLKLIKAISSLIIAYVENTFISPQIWRKLSKGGKKQLLKELILTVPPIRSMQTKFFHSKINLLDRTFKKNTT